MSDPVFSVLVIDHDVQVAEDFCRAVLGLPVAVLRAGDWDQGLRFYHEYLPKMVLMDSGLDHGEVPSQTLIAADSALEVVLTTDRWTQDGALAAVARGASAQTACNITLRRRLYPTLMFSLYSWVARLT